MSISPLSKLLDELESLLCRLPAPVYRARSAAAVSGSIGEHVRHCLDHVSALLAADASSTLSYDRRCRGTTVECDPDEAIRRIRELKQAIAMWPHGSLDQPIQVAAVVSPAGEALIGWSTLARELAFVVNHTIHHQAIIGVLLAAHGGLVPERFGYSPSTPVRH